MKKKVLISSLVSLGFLGLVGASVASANGYFGWNRNIDPKIFAENQQVMFQQEANFLGITVEEVKNYWAQGKGLKEIAKELNIDNAQLMEKMKQAQLDKMKLSLQSLVDSGVITQSQADSRLKAMESKLNNGKFGQKMKRGFMRGWR